MTTGPRILRCITIHQPFAQYIALGIKTIESRKHNRFRGLVGKRIGIHASKNDDWYWDIEKYTAVCKTIQEAGKSCAVPISHGAIIATAHVVGARMLVPSDSKNACVNICDGDNLYGLILRSVEMLDYPAFVRGKQGIWKWQVPEGMDIG